MFEVRNRVRQHPETEHQYDERHEHGETIELESQVETQRRKPVQGGAGRRRHTHALGHHHRRSRCENDEPESRRHRGSAAQSNEGEPADGELRDDRHEEHHWMLKITTVARWTRTTAPTSRLAWKLVLMKLRAGRTSRWSNFALVERRAK